MRASFFWFLFAPSVKEAGAMVNGFVQPSTPTSRTSPVPFYKSLIIVLRRLCHLRPCSSCLFFFQKINVGRRLKELHILNISMRRFEKVVECFENYPTF